MLTFAHNRPNDNDCYDEFVDWANDLGFRIRYQHWSTITPTGRVVCAMQDPLKPGRIKKLEQWPVEWVNSPAAMNRARRDIAYPAWRAGGIRCPAGPFDYDREDIIRQGCFPILLKDIYKQMGKGYLIWDEERLNQVHFEFNSFDDEKFKVMEYIESPFPDGLNRLHRFVVCGGRALPVVLSATKSWSSKASHMKKDLDRIDVGSFKKELLEFWHSEPHPHVVECVKALGLDFALVDACMPPSGVPIFWEVNPYMNLRPKEATGKRERWWPFFLNYLYNADLPVAVPNEADAEAYVQNIRDWQGYKMHWRSK